MTCGACVLTCTDTCIPFKMRAHCNIRLHRKLNFFVNFSPLYSNYKEFCNWQCNLQCSWFTLAENLNILRASEAPKKSDCTEHYEKMTMLLTCFITAIKNPSCICPSLKPHGLKSNIDLQSLPLCPLTAHKPPKSTLWRAACWLAIHWCGFFLWHEPSVESWGQEDCGYIYCKNSELPRLEFVRFYRHQKLKSCFIKLISKHENHQGTSHEQNK